jgi:Tn3 transposase DDE domain
VQHLSPHTERLIGGKDHRPFSEMAIIHHMEQNIGSVVHSDTQGQSTTVFAFTHLLGINLMPRIRNWKDLHFFRPSKKPATKISIPCSLK